MWHDLGAKGLLDEESPIDIMDETTINRQALLNAIFRNVKSSSCTYVLNGTMSLANDQRRRVNLDVIKGGVGSGIKNGGCAV